MAAAKVSEVRSMQLVANVPAMPTNRPPSRRSTKRGRRHSEAIPATSLLGPIPNAPTEVSRRSSAGTLLTSGSSFSSRQSASPDPGHISGSSFHGLMAEPAAVDTLLPSGTQIDPSKASPGVGSPFFRQHRRKSASVAVLRKEAAQAAALMEKSPLSPGGARPSSPRTPAASTPRSLRRRRSEAVHLRPLRAAMGHLGAVPGVGNLPAALAAIDVPASIARAGGPARLRPLGSGLKPLPLAPQRGTSDGKAQEGDGIVSPNIRRRSLARVSSDVSLLARRRPPLPGLTIPPPRPAAKLDPLQVSPQQHKPQLNKSLSLDSHTTKLPLRRLRSLQVLPRQVCRLVEEEDAANNAVNVELRPNAEGVLKNRPHSAATQSLRVAATKRLDFHRPPTPSLLSPARRKRRGLSFDDTIGSKKPVVQPKPVRAGKARWEESTQWGDADVWIVEDSDGEVDDDDSGDGDGKVNDGDVEDGKEFEEDVVVLSSHDTQHSHK